MTYLSLNYYDYGKKLTGKQNLKLLYTFSKSPEKHYKFFKIPKR